MKIAIIGTGGVGGYFGGMMAKSGFDVTFVARGEHYKIIREKGLKIKSISGDFIINNVQITDRINEIEKADLILLGIKAWQVKEVASELKSIIQPSTAVLPLQNGVLASDELKNELNKKNVLGGLCRIMSKIEAPGVINHFGIPPFIVFGELNNETTDRVKKIKEVFDLSGINSKIADDIQAELWKKFIPICVSGLLAVTRSTYGELREIPETRKMMTELIKENYALSQKLGVNIEPDFVDKTIAFIDSFPYDSTSSLSRDVIENKPSEIDYQNGTAVKLGLKAGIEMPINSFVYYSILPMEKQARSK